MDLKELKNQLALDLAMWPQREAKAQNAVDSLSAAIGELASLGYRFAVVEELGQHVAPVPEEFPKMLYRQGDFPREVTVETEEDEAKARAAGYAGLGHVPAPVAQAPAAAPESEPEAED